MRYLTATRMVDICRFTLTLAVDGALAAGIEVAPHGLASVSTADALARVWRLEARATRMLNEQIAAHGYTAAAPRGGVELWWSESAPPTTENMWTVQWSGEDTQP